MPDFVYTELRTKTPGFTTFQGMDWEFHCNDACEFHGEVTFGDFKAISNSELERLYSNGSLSPGDMEEFNEGDDNMETVYYFKFVCRHCGEFRFMLDHE